MNLLWTEGMERSLQVNVGRSGCQVACAAGACRISQVRWSYQVISPLSWSQATKEHFKPRASDPSDTVTIAKIERVSIIYTISSLGLSTSHRDQSSGHAYPMQSMRTVMLELELVVTFAFFVVFQSWPLHVVDDTVKGRYQTCTYSSRAPFPKRQVLCLSPVPSIISNVTSSNRIIDLTDLSNA